MLSSELMPALHVSSFQADKAVRELDAADRRAGLPRADPGGVRGDRGDDPASVTEGTSIVIEGVHVVPGFFDVTEHGDRLVAVPPILEVEDEAKHLNHFASARRGSARGALRELREHQEAAAVRQEPGALTRRPDRRTTASTRHLRRPRSRDGAGDGLGGAARAARGGRGREDGMRLFLDTASIEETREDQPRGSCPASRRTRRSWPRRARTPTWFGRRSSRRWTATSRSDHHRARGGSDGRGGRRLAGMAPNAVEGLR